MPNKHRHTPISYRPAADLRARLEAYSGETGRPVRAVITDALRAWFDDLDDEPGREWGERAAAELRGRGVGALLDFIDSGAPGDPAADVAEPGELAAAVDAVTVCVCQHHRSGHRNERGSCGVGSCMCSRYRRRRG